MLFNVINYSGVVIGQVDASNIVEAWSEAGKKYENILDVREVKTTNTNLKRKYPIVWDIRLEHPSVNSPKWENYKRLVEYFKQHKLKMRGAIGSIVIENVPTQRMVDELTSLIRLHNLEIFEVTIVEQIPEFGEEE